ncbi:MAG: GDSL-type esterase/lipase family protein [bacterium]
MASRQLNRKIKSGLVLLLWLSIIISSTYSFPHYYQRVSQFESENETLKNVVLVGDSITEGFNVKKYFPGQRVLNRGIGGDGVGIGKIGVLRRLDNSVFNCNPSHIFIMIGINDLSGKRTPDEITSAYRDVLNRIQIRLPEVPVYVESVLPCRDHFADRNPQVIELNIKLKHLARQYGYHYLDLHPLMKDSTGQLRQEYSSDGIHLKPAAYAVWKQEIDKALGNPIESSPALTISTTVKQ